MEHNQMYFEVICQICVSLIFPVTFTLSLNGIEYTMLFVHLPWYKPWNFRIEYIEK